MGYSTTFSAPAQCGCGDYPSDIHETDTVPERYQEDENTCEIEAGSIYVNGFGMVASIVMRDKAISTPAKALYSYLMTYSGRTGEAWPSTSRILEEMNLSKPSFYKYRDELRQHGFIDWTTFGRKAGGRRTVYTIKMFVKTRPRENDTKFSTMPSSEQWSKNFTIAPEPSTEGVEKWKTACGKPHEGKNSLPKYGKNSLPSNLNRQIRTDKNSTTSQPVDNPPLKQCGTAHAEPVVSSPTAPSSDVDLDLREKNEETPLMRDSIDEAFFALEARSLRRTGSPAVKEAARLTYRRLVTEGHSIEDISAAYDNYLAWVKSDNVKNPRGMWKWLEKDFKRNNDEAKEKREPAQKATSPSGEGGLDAAEYRRRSQEVSTIGFDAEAEYRVEFAEQSDDEHLRHLAASVRADEPVTVGNGLVDDRLSKRPSYDVLWSRINKKEHHKDYVLWTYDKLKDEGKVR